MMSGGAVITTIYGGGWVGVTKIDDEDALRDAYDKSGKKVMQLQQAILPFDLFVRCVGLGPQIRVVRYDPSAPLHGRYVPGKPDFVNAAETSVLRDMTLTINSFFGWDFNSCESLRRNGTFHPIDFANPCPDSQVTSLHYHFRGSSKRTSAGRSSSPPRARRCARTSSGIPSSPSRRRGCPSVRRSPAMPRSPTSATKRRASRSSAGKHLAHLDEIAWEFFGDPIAKDAVHQKVKALYPAHEVESFTDHFFGQIQDWREKEGPQRKRAVVVFQSSSGGRVKQIGKWHSDRLQQEIQLVRWGTFRHPRAPLPHRGR